MANTAVVCMADEGGRKIVDALLKKHGLQVLHFFDTASLLRTVKSRDIEIVILDEEGNHMQFADLLGSIAGSQASAEVVVFSERHSDLGEWIKKELIFGYFSLPWDRYEIEQLLLGALVNSRRIRKMQREMEDLKYKLKRRTLIEKAKEIVAQQRNISLDKAHTILTQMSMRKSISLETIAKSIVENDEQKHR